MGALMMGWGMMQVYCAIHYGWNDPAYLAMAVLLPLMLGFGLLGYVNWKGTTYLEQPKLCPELVAPGS
jgi:hypothetical protein